MRESSFYEQHVGPDNRIIWPEDPVARKQLARDLLGFSLVATLDYWIDLATDYVSNPEPAEPFVRHNEAWKRDSLYRSVFRTLSTEQREMVLALVRDVTSGVLFGSIVDVDQFPPADVEIAMIEREDHAVGERVVLTSGEGDLHDEVHDWINRFSHHASKFES
jgi:hypothetical protein